MRITADAFIDLANISSFGSEIWGEVSSRKYTDALIERLNQLKQFPELEPIGPQRPAFRRLGVGSHSAFYQIEGDEVVIARMLHMSQEPARHLH